MLKLTYIILALKHHFGKTICVHTVKKEIYYAFLWCWWKRGRVHCFITVSGCSCHWLVNETLRAGVRQLLASRSGLTREKQNGLMMMAYTSD